MTVLDLADIQGNILRGYRAANARHLAVNIPHGGNGPALLRDLLSSEPPCLSTAEQWEDRGRPDHMLNLGLTWPGLRAMGVSDNALDAFPDAFKQGAATRATAPDPDGLRGVGLGDVADSAPGTWAIGGPSTADVHMVLSLFSDERHRAAREPLSAALRERLAHHGLTEVWSADADALPGGRVHFGYRDGIAQPRIEGAPGRQPADMQPSSPAGDFLLGAGHVNSYGGNHIGAIPAALGDNATYAAFRVLAQDCRGFEELLDVWATRYSVDREWLAAKLMGRWRSGSSLMTHPDRPDPVPSDAELNGFDYAPSAQTPMYIDDIDGVRCPVGSHVRRLNPRSSPSMGVRGTRRLLRRGMPYGAPYDPRHPADGIERGLIGLFVCGDLELQYEFVLRVWANQDLGAPGLRGTREPMIGAQPTTGGLFRVPVARRTEPLLLTGLPTLTRTRGSVYCLMPGLGAIRTLAAAA
ncbi:MAG: Dyp-type peroxidase [Solirubrobacteraceae bacterium]